MEKTFLAPVFLKPYLLCSVVKESFHNSTPRRKNIRKSTSQNPIRICYLKKKYFSETLTFLKPDFEIL